VGVDPLFRKPFHTSAMTFAIIYIAVAALLSPYEGRLGKARGKVNGLKEMFVYK
jgi:hypothetical protein